MKKAILQNELILVCTLIIIRLIIFCSSYIMRGSIIDVEDAGTSINLSVVTWIIAPFDTGVIIAVIIGFLLVYKKKKYDEIDRPEIRGKRIGITAVVVLVVGIVVLTGLTTDLKEIFCNHILQGNESLIEASYNIWCRIPFFGDLLTNFQIKEAIGTIYREYIEGINNFDIVIIAIANLLYYWS